jgi:cytochrome c-type biogenesis protein CcsB
MFTLAYFLLWLALVAHLARGARWTGRAATGATAAALIALTLGLIGRGLAAGHWPLTNRYEFALWFVWAIVAVYFLGESTAYILEIKWQERRVGAAVLAMALLVATYALLRPADEQAIRPLLPALRSIWLQIHVLSAAIGYAACGVAAGLAAVRLIQARLSDEWLPASGEIERAMERVVTWGFPLLTLGILSGAIWAQNAWGRYWSWDPKETWALVTWLWYLLILHVRGLRGWRGRRLAALVVIGFAIVFFSFAGLPALIRVVRLESLHGF